MADSNSRLILVGIIGSAHGVRGQVKLRSFTSSPENITSYGDLQDTSGNRYRVKLVSGNKDVLIAKVEGVDTRDAAEKLRNIKLYVERSALPEPKKNEYYHEDLVGLEATTEDGAAYGHVVGVHNFGAGDIIEIKLVSGKEELLPFNKATFPVVDVKNKKLVVSPPEVI